MSWSTVSTGWKRQQQAPFFRGDYPLSETVSLSLSLYPISAGDPRIIRQWPKFLGYDYIIVSDINMGNEIDTTAVSGEIPFPLFASAKNVTCNGRRSFSSEPIHPFEHLQHKWTITKDDGSPCNYSNEIINPLQNNVINPYLDQVGGEACFLLREPGTYILQLTSSAPNGETNWIRKTITVLPDVREHRFFDGLNGNDANDGLDPWGFGCINATYTESTGELTEIGKFVSYDHDAATASNHTDNYNVIYLGATHEWRRIAGKISDDTIVLDVDSKLGGDFTGLTSSSGAKQTYNGGNVANTFTHVRGNQGATEYTITTSCGFNFGASSLDNIHVGGYDGDGVVFKADPSFSGLVFSIFTNQSGGAPPIATVHNIHVDAGGFSKSFGGALGSTSDTDTSFFVLDRCTSERISGSNGIELQSTQSTKPWNLLLWSVDIINFKVASEQKRQGLFISSATGRMHVIGGSITGEADNQSLDHYIYPSSKDDHTNISHVLFTGGIGYNYCVNGNATGDLNYFCVTDCYGEGDVNWFNDLSESNNDPSVSSFKNIYIARNAIKPNRAFMYHYAGKQLTILDNIQIGGDREMINHDVNTAGYVDSEFSYVNQRNWCYGFGFENDTKGAHRETVDNISYDDRTSARVLSVNTSVFDDDVIYDFNNFYTPNDLDGNIIVDDLINISLNDFNTATGKNNIAIDPLWPDPNNGVFK